MVKQHGQIEKNYGTLKKFLENSIAHKNEPCTPMRDTFSENICFFILIRLIIRCAL